MKNKWSAIFILLLTSLSILHLIFTIKTDAYFSLDDFAVLNYLQNHTILEMISQFLSSIVGSVLNSCKRKNRHSPEPAPPGRAAIKPGSCSVRFLAKTLSISNTSAWRMKRLGTIWGYLSVTSQKPEQRLYRLLWAIIRSEERQIDGNPEWYIRQVNPVHVIECNVKSGKVSKLER